MNKYHIYVTSKMGVFDPGGETAKNALANLGFEGVDDVRIGKFIELEGDCSLEDVTEMCEKLLANPIIEDFRIELAPEATPQTGRE